MDHFYPEFEKEADLASFLAPVTERIQGFFQSKEKKRAARRVEGFHKTEDKDWDGFTDQTSRKSFVKQLGSDTRSDPKLLQYADNMNRLKTGKQVGEVQGSRGTYKIVKLRGQDRLGCSCNDWRYKKSVAQPGEQVDCKHIRQFQQLKVAGVKKLEPSQGERAEWEKRVAQAALSGGDGASLMKTEEGFAAYTHRSRSKFYPSPASIPLGKIRSVAKTASYREGGSFTHDGQKYSLDAALRSAESRPALQFSVDELKWVLQHDRPDPSRVRAADLRAPLLLAPDRRGRWTVIDGLHRLAKAVRAGKDSVPVKILALSELQKTAAAVTSTLKPHQERVLRKLEDSDGVIVAHRVGAGKTLTSIAAGVASGRPMEVITPASLTKNYEKELKKHVKGEVKARISSYEKAVRRGAKEGEDSVEPGSFLVLDEAHRLRNGGTLTSKTLRPAALEAHKRLLLTGTTLYNRPSDVGPLANVAAGETVLPADPTRFDQKFIQESEVSPGLWNRLRGVKPGLRKDLKNASLLRKALSGRIDVHSEASAEDFPEQIEERIAVPMSPKQEQVYEAVMGAAPAHVRRKIRAGLPPSKQESRMLNAFTTAGRQASLSPRPYVDDMTNAQEAENTPKIQEAARRLLDARKTDRRFRGVVYSNYIEAGLKPYERALKRRKIKFNTLTGKLNAKQKARVVDEYNSGQTPILLVSSSGTEGLDLKGTKMVQVLEPHWNNSKIDQVIGRGVRYQSHAHLPKKERKVQVQRFYSSLPKGFLGRNKGKSTEQWIQDRADDKTRLSNQLREVFQQASDEPPQSLQGHVAQRIQERAPGSGYEVAKIQARIPKMTLRPGKTYHVPLARGRGWVVIGDIGGRHVVKTVFGPNMRPPGERVLVKQARAPRDYKKEYAEYHATPEQRKNRSLRNQARRKVGLSKGDPREVDHKTPLSRGGGNGSGNLRAVSFELNRKKSNGEAR
jgi:superfamily II DNA or RNA helicase